MEEDRFSYRIEWSEEDEEYVGLCAEFPSLSWLSRSHTGALRGIRKLVAEVVDDMLEQGEVVPEPLSLRQFSGKFVVRVPPEMHRKLVLEAAEAGVSLNRMVSLKLAS
jgi:predicted HicB family RNase H-like nuclease